MVTAAEPAAAIGEARVDLGRLEFRLGVTEQERDRLRCLVGRLHAKDELESFAAGVIPAKRAFRLARGWLRSKGNSIEGGTSEIMLDIVAKRLLELPAD